MKTTTTNYNENKLKELNRRKAFDFNNANYLRYELTEYIKDNLYCNSLAIQKDNKIFGFDWNYQPQRTGTGRQQETYQTLTIRNKAEQIIEVLTNQKTNK